MSTRDVPPVAPAVAGGASIPLPPVPPRIGEGGKYDQCLGMVPDDPSGALAFSEAWAQAGGGAGAAHCRALATAGLGDPAGAATLLDALATGGTGPVAARAAIADQAAQAWTMAGDPVRAFDSAGLALDLYGDDPDLLVGHATAAVRLGRDAVAIADLDRALALDPRRVDAWALLASAHRGVGAFDDAGRDVDAALRLDGDDPDALLERGLLRQHSGDLDGARADWERLMSLSPDSPVSDLAEQNIALLDAGPAMR